MQIPKLPHLTTALRMLQYPKTNPGQGIILNSALSLKLVPFCDADWTLCPKTRRSVSGFYIALGGSPISWKSKKHDFLSLSSAEAEYCSMCKVIAELTWLTRLLDDLSIPPSLSVPVLFDSQSAIHIA